MRRKLSSRLLILLTSLNTFIFTALGYHDTESAGVAISFPSYSEPTGSLAYLILPGILMFFAIQQTIETKLQGKWRHDEPARKYSTIISLVIVGFSIISPIFHAFPTLDPYIYSGLLASMAATALIANKWQMISEKLPV